MISTATKCSDWLSLCASCEGHLTHPVLVLMGNRVYSDKISPPFEHWLLHHLLHILWSWWELDGSFQDRMGPFLVFIFITYPKASLHRQCSTFLNIVVCWSRLCSLVHKDKGTLPFPSFHTRCVRSISHNVQPNLPYINLRNRGRQHRLKLFLQTLYEYILEYIALYEVLKMGLIMVYEWDPWLLCFGV